VDEYSVNAEAYVARTASLDLGSLHDHFLPRIPVGGTILDAGCGSGRDAAAFAALGYQVHAFDQSPEMVRPGKHIRPRRFLIFHAYDFAEWKVRV
jgi:SAM-dependent methyltransferase